MEITRGRPEIGFDEQMYVEIVALRKELRLSKYRCAQLLDVTSSAYLRYENEKSHFIGVEKQKQLLQILRDMKKARMVR